MAEPKSTMVALLCLVLFSVRLAPTDATENVCQRPLGDLREIFEGVYGDGYTVYINCISYDQDGAMSTAIVSGVAENSSLQRDARYRFECIGGVPVAIESTQPVIAVEDATGCLECVDSDQPCNRTCASQCARCYQTPGNCTLCTAKVFDPDEVQERCVSGCQGREQPNPDNRNVCEFTCNSGQAINLRQYPPALDAEELGEEVNLPDEEALFHQLVDRGADCIQSCPTPSYMYRPGEPGERTKICFACGIDYCIECREEEQICTRCVLNTALYTEEHTCEVGVRGNLAVIAELQEREVEEEEEENEQTQLELAISLPIVCVAVVLAFIGMGAYAHYRYPHISHHGTKRHRRKTEAAEPPDELENVWRARPTIRLR